MAHILFQSKVTLGELVSFNVYLGMMIWPMFAIGELINVMQRGNASLDRVNETLAYELDVKDPKHPKLVQEPDYIQFDDVTFSYPSSTETNLKKVSFTLKQGKRLVLLEKQEAEKRRSYVSFFANIRLEMEILQSRCDIRSNDE